MAESLKPLASAVDSVRPLLRVRQMREFTEQPVDEAALHAITEAARWSGSGKNTQPWRFIVIRDIDTIRGFAAAGLPQTRSLRTAMAAIAIVMPSDPHMATSVAYDEARAAERMLIAATFVGLGAGIAWIRTDVRDVVRERLVLPEDRFVRTIMAIGHPTDAARLPKAEPGMARRPREELIFEERWPGE